MNEKKIFIHVGLPKTGTTFLQKHFFPKLDLDYYGNELIKKTVNGKTLFSDESFYGNFIYERNAECILDNIKKLYPNANILFVKRNKDKWLHSCYKQYLTNKKDKNSYISFNEYKSNVFIDEALDFEYYLDMCNNRFKNVYILEYVHLLKNEKRFFREICNILDVEIPNYENIKENISLKKYHYKFLFNIDKFFPNMVVNFFDGFFRRINGEKKTNR